MQNGNGCDVTVDTKSSAAGTALANGINGSSIIDITFAPTQAVCNQVCSWSGVLQHSPVSSMLATWTWQSAAHVSVRGWPG